MNLLLDSRKTQEATSIEKLSHTRSTEHQIYKSVELREKERKRAREREGGRERVRHRYSNTKVWVDI